MIPASSASFFLILICVAANGEVIRDIGSRPTIIETDKLPMLADGKTPDVTAMPSVGNGHIATSIYSDTVYMDGVYNGRLSKSHRARIPAEINLRTTFRNEDTRQVYRQYRLDMGHGYWEENATVEECRVTLRVYAHQFYTRLLVTEIFAERQGTATGNLMIYLNVNRGENSKDINFKTPQSFNGGNWKSEGTTITAEMSRGHTSRVHIFWSTIPPTIHIPSHKDSIRYTYIMAIDTNEERAKESYVSGSWVADKNPMHFFDLHCEAWNKKWSEGGIQLSGDIYLEKLAYTAFYYLLSSLPALDTHRRLDDYGGMSSSGLAHGSERDSGRGHISWDQERWIFPAILPFYPRLARSLLNYRINTMPAARVQAIEKGYHGLLYSWKSAATGIDVTPPFEAKNHLHLIGDISFAMRQYTSVDRDRSWLRENGGCEMIKELASFWYSKLNWNNKTQHYDIQGVATVDGSKGSVNNCVYTNAVASLALHYSKYAACLCNVDVNMYAPQGQLHAAQNIHWEYNDSVDYNPLYEGFTGGSHSVKQSGAVLLGYPLMFNLSRSTIEQNLQLYAEELPLSTSSTVWSMLAINWLALGNKSEANKAFETSYKSYVSQPYKMWMEYPNTGGSNYHSAMGTFIQTLLYGYGGLRIHLEYLYMNPQLPANIHSMIFRNIDYLGSSFDIKVTPALVHVSVDTIGIAPLRLTIAESNKSLHLTRGASILFDRAPFTINTDALTECPLPEDNIVPYSTSYTPSAHISVNSSSAFLLLPNAIIYFILLLYTCARTSQSQWVLL
ncbi:protein-glucosylgalactosylhydroxylysine glucosidase-like isoform X2 [Watersipora subatra]|uniref:protein-glucosylgalactosylhydroxylysine glucosidase-like isoform X2 n=1 Tax=Watersipora subatra TaxID=2589382 RepID=UPI00355C0305